MMENVLGEMEVDYRQHEDVVKLEAKVTQLLEALPQIAANTPDLSTHDVLRACSEVCTQLLVYAKASVIDVAEQAMETDYQIGLTPADVEDLQARVSIVHEKLLEAAGWFGVQADASAPGPGAAREQFEGAGAAREQFEGAASVLEGVVEELAGLLVEEDVDLAAESGPRIDLDMGGGK